MNLGCAIGDSLSFRLLELIECFVAGALPSAYPEEAVQTSDTESQSEDEEG